MSQSFAALENRLNQAVFKHASNAACSALDGQGVMQTFDGVFDAASAAQFGGMVSDVAPQVLCKTADISALAWSGGITVAGTAYTVTDIAHDGTGVTTLALRKA